MDIDDNDHEYEVTTPKTVLAGLICQGVGDVLGLYEVYEEESNENLQRNQSSHEGKTQEDWDKE